MTIDLATEENLRKVLFAALKGNHSSFEQALEAFADKDSLRPPARVQPTCRL